MSLFNDLTSTRIASRKNRSPKKNAIVIYNEIDTSDLVYKKGKKIKLRNLICRNRKLMFCFG